MIIKSFPLIRPNVFTTQFKELTYTPDKFIVKPNLLSICAADLRYYLGLRPASVISQKLPMVLIHEAIGTVIKSTNNSKIKVGTKVILLPCGNNCESNSNYKPNAFFRSSNADGFCQELLALDFNEILPISTQNDHRPYVFTELLSVCFQAISQIRDSLDQATSVGIWGDGSLGYLMTLLIKSRYNNKIITIIGKNESKLEKFTFADYRETVFNRSKKNFDVLIECVGGEGAQEAINDMILSSNSKSVLLLSGVSEKFPSINTRGILEKGLTVKGITRSVRSDFINANELLKSSKIRKLVGELETSSKTVNNIKELRDAFELSCSSKFKTIIDFLP